LSWFQLEMQGTKGKSIETTGHVSGHPIRDPNEMELRLRDHCVTQT